MRIRSRLFLLAALLLAHGTASADFLEISRNATVRERSNSSSRILHRLERGDRIQIAPRVGKRNGYYRVIIPGTTNRGWVYKTLGRRHRGDIPTDGTTPTTTPATTPTTTIPTAAPGAIVMGGQAIPPTLRDAALITRLRGLISQNQTRISFRRARRLILSTIDRRGSGTTASVRCVYSSVIVQLERRTDDDFRIPDGRNVDIEHTWPRNAEWGNGVGVGTIAEIDLHALYPTLAGLNRSRSNHRFGVPTVNIRPLRVRENGFLQQGSTGGTATGCQSGQNAAGHDVFEPRGDHRGNAARAIFYISVRYAKPVPLGMETILKSWHLEDPVDAAERARETRIEAQQGNSNPFVDFPQLLMRIADY